MNEQERKVYNVFQTLTSKQQYTILAEICQNVVEAKRYEDAAEFIVQQLGGDAMTVLAMYK